MLLDSSQRLDRFQQRTGRSLTTGCIRVPLEMGLGLQEVRVDQRRKQHARVQHVVGVVVVGAQAYRSIGQLEAVLPETLQQGGQVGLGDLLGMLMDMFAEAAKPVAPVPLEDIQPAVMPENRRSRHAPQRLIALQSQDRPEHCMIAGAGVRFAFHTALKPPSVLAQIVKQAGRSALILAVAGGSKRRGPRSHRAEVIPERLAQTAAILTVSKVLYWPFFIHSLSPCSKPLQAHRSTCPHARLGSYCRVVNHRRIIALATWRKPTNQRL